MLTIAGFSACASGMVIPVAYYKLGDEDPGPPAPPETGNAMTIDSAGDADLTRTNTPSYVSDTSTNALDSTVSMNFTEPDLYALAGTSPLTNTTSVGMEVWVKAIDPVTTERIIALNGTTLDGYGFSIDPSGDTFRVHFPSVATTLFVGNAVYGEWAHLGMTIDSTGEITTYFNGVPAITNNAVTPHPPGSMGTGPGFYIGHDGGTRAFAGTIDQVRLFTFLDGEFAPGDFLLTHLNLVGFSITLPQDAARLSFNSDPGQSYKVQSRESLTTGSWTSTPVTVHGTGFRMNIVDLLSPATQRFYRIVPPDFGIVRIIEAEEADDSSGVSFHDTYITSLDPGDWTLYEDIDLTDVVSIDFGVASATSGTRIQVRTGSPGGTIVAELTVSATGGPLNWSFQTAAVTGTAGVHDLYVTSSDINTVKLDKLVLRAEGPPVPFVRAYGVGIYDSGPYGP